MTDAEWPAAPTAGVIDSQSVKADAVVRSDSRGFDGGKLVNGRRWHVVVDTIRLPLGFGFAACLGAERASASRRPEAASSRQGPVGEQPGGIAQPSDAVAARRSSRAASA